MLLLEWVGLMVRLIGLVGCSGRLMVVANIDESESAESESEAEDDGIGIGLFILFMLL